MEAYRIRSLILRNASTPHLTINSTSLLLEGGLSLLRGNIPPELSPLGLIPKVIAIANSVNFWLSLT